MVRLYSARTFQGRQSCRYNALFLTVDLDILPVPGPDIVLGMDWLESLGKVTADFAGKTLACTQWDKPVVLMEILPPLRRINFNSLA